MKTIEAARLIDLNAERIASAPNQRREVCRLIGQYPSSGFDSESEDTVRSRASAVLYAWKSAGSDGEKLTFFRDGFGTDPCLAARLNGVMVFLAEKSGIPVTALRDIDYDPGKAAELAEAAEDFLEKNRTAGWEAIRAHLFAQDPELAARSDRFSLLNAVKEGLLLDQNR